jgi:hypothetical protein
MRSVRMTIVGVCVVAVAGLAVAAQRARQVTVEVYKTSTCGCCSNWVTHLQQNGFATRVTDIGDLSEIKTRHQVPRGVQSCHTAVVEGYVVEGHVPAKEIQRLLRERPPVAGLAVPGMPVGSPGMEVGTRVEAYDVLTFDRRGRTGVFASYPARAE